MPGADATASQDPRAYLNSLILHGVKLGLQNILGLMDACDNPHLTYPVVHVGGTNGKGSVLTFLSAILKASGYQVGRFTSPHLLDVTERFLMDGHPMSEADLRDTVARLRTLAEENGITPTFFEMNTAMAFHWFVRQKVDVALVEVGMGGRYDSTNIVAPLACAITNVDLDHTQYLGDTRAKIAFEKAGILKAGVPAVIGVRLPDALEVIEAQARERAVPLYCASRDYRFEVSGTVWRPEIDYRGFGEHFPRLVSGLAGPHQAANAAVAVSLALLLRDRFPRIAEPEIRAGLEAARWPGRLERVLDNPPVVMDVAHNPAGCATLAAAFKQCVLVFSVSSDKDAAAMLDLLAPIARPLLLTAYRGGRTLPIEALRQCAAGHTFEVCANLDEALEVGMRKASADRPLLVTGSIYAAGEARRILVERYGARPVSFEPDLALRP